MRAFGLACICVFLALACGRSTHAQAQSDAGAVLLPPASIPLNRSRPATSRANFDAPNPLPRPVFNDPVTREPDQDALVSPPVPTPARAPTTAALPPITPDRLALANPDTPHFVPPNPTPRSELVLRAPSEHETAGGLEEELVAARSTGDLTSEAGINSPCHRALTAAGAVFEPRGRVEGEGQCGIDDAVALQAVGSIVLQPAALITCPTASIFAAFVQETISPQARETMGSEPSTIYVAASYACRGRNNVAGARISEHAFGRAVDVRALRLEDGQDWHVRPHDAESEEPAARFQAALREEACGPFNTVLGPGSDGHHSDHLHFDTARRSSSYCR